MADDKSISVNQWTANQRKFMLWLSLPTVDRIPLPQQMLAGEMRVAEETLCRWKHLPGFEQEVQALIRANLGDVLHEVVGSFKSEARKGEFAHQKMYFEMLGWYTPAQRIEGEVIVKFTRMDSEGLR